ncbi:hypothetical protein L1987_88040 [Smallanthus sonchifolius]|nr:hypothetical protein L1987_88040 [Smallanthus sonchifolius]
MNRLESLEIINCETMMEVFESESNVDEGSAHVSTSLTLENITIVVPLLSNLKHVCIERCDLLSHVFTFSTLESRKQLKLLKVGECKAIQVIVKEENGSSSKNVVFPRLEILVLDDLPSVKGFFLGMNEFRWPLLDNVMTNDCPQLMMCDLITFPSSYDPTITKGIPCSFHNLVEIEQSYNDVETILPSIKSSNRVNEVIVKEDEEFDGKVNEIILPRLKSFKLNSLQSLKGFCLGKKVFSWPSLDALEIRDCSAVTVFTNGYLSTPDLKVIDTSFGKYYVKPDLNSFVKTKQQEGYEF